MNNKIAIIIGAGPAGLTAACELITSTGYIPVAIKANRQATRLVKNR